MAFGAGIASGSGTGDLLSSNNLTDVANTATAFSNLGGAAIGKLATVVKWFGPFMKNNPAASGTAVGTTIAGVASSGPPANIALPYAGTLVAVAWTFGGAHGIGTIQVRARKNGTGDTTLQSDVSGTSDVKGTKTGTGVAFAAGDTIGCEYDTSSDWNGTTGNLAVYFGVSMAV